MKGGCEFTDKQFVQLEKDIFIGFYSIRKLIEAITKVTDANKKMKVEIEWHPNRKPVNWRNNHRIDELYALDKAHKEIRDIWFVSSRIIHSFILNPVINENSELEGLFFTSDTDKNKKLYFIHIDQVINIFEAIGRDYPSHISSDCDPNTGEENTEVK